MRTPSGKPAARASAWPACQRSRKRSANGPAAAGHAASSASVSHPQRARRNMAQARRATTSISTFTSRGKRATCTVERAGVWLPKRAA